MVLGSGGQEFLCSMGWHTAVCGLLEKSSILTQLRSFVYGYFCAIIEELNNCGRDHVVRKHEIFTIIPFTKKVC